MTKTTLRHRITDSIIDYTSKSPKSFDIVPDPNNSDFWAVRATFYGGKTMDLLYEDSGEDPIMRIEEVEYTSWPPTSR